MQKTILTAAFTTGIAVSIASVAAPKAEAQFSPQRLKSHISAEDVFATIKGARYTQGLPSNFPVPAYPNNVVNKFFTNSTSGAPNAAANITTKDPPSQVHQWYRDQLKSAGWVAKVMDDKVMTKYGKGGQIYLISANKANQEITVCSALNKKTGGTTIAINWNKLKPK